MNEQQKIYTTLLSQLVMGKWITGQEIQQFLTQIFFPKLGAGQEDVLLRAVHIGALKELPGQLVI